MVWAFGPRVSSADCIPTLDEQGHTLGLLDVLDKGVFLLSERVLVDKSSISQNIRRQVIHRVLRDTSTGELQSIVSPPTLDLPLHIPSLRSSKRKDAILDQDVQTHRVDTLLVDQDETLWLFARPDRLVTHGILELYDFLELGVDKSSLRLDELFTLLGRVVEEARVDLAVVSSSIADSRLFIFERDIQSEDKGILHALGHIGMSRTVVHDQTADQLGIRVGLVLHLHDFDHVQVDWLTVGIDSLGISSGYWWLDSEDCVDNIGSELLGEFSVEFR
jgi:hypothetical protein